MRVALLAEQLLYRSPGGIGRYTAQLLSGLPGGEAGDSVVPFTALHRRRAVERCLADAAAGSAERATILPLPRPALYEAWLRVGAPPLPGFGGADLVHAPALAVPPHPRVPLVVTVHDAAPELFPDSFPPRGRRFHRMGLDAAARRADLVLTVSHAAAAEIAEHSSIGAERIRVVHNAVDPPDLGDDRCTELLSGLGLAGRPYVLWVGSLEPRKGVTTAVAALAALRRRGSPAAEGVALVLAGYQGWLGAGLVDQSDAVTLGDDLVQAGTVGEEMLWALYRGATVFAFPSRHEGFGLPVVEAMSQGVPVVASDIAAVREVSGGAARLVAPGDVTMWADALDDLLGDPSARERLGAGGRERSRSFGLPAMLAGVRAAYAEVAGS